VRRADKLTTLPIVLKSESLKSWNLYRDYLFVFEKNPKIVSHVQRSNSATVQTSPRAQLAFYTMVHSRGQSGLDMALTVHPHQV